MSTAMVVHRAILDAMLRGELAPGSWVRQDDLATRLGVSKIPVREALQRLAAARLVTFEPGRGAQVRRLSSADAEEIYDLRLAIEPRLLGRAVGRMTVVDLAEAELALQGAAVSPTEANWTFHSALYRPAGWHRAHDVVESLHAVVAPYVVLYTEGLGGAPASDAQHVELLAHCRAGEVPQAQRVLQDHLAQAASALVGALGD